MGAAARAPGVKSAGLPCLVPQNCLFIVFGRFALRKCDCTGGAGRQAVAQSVAVVVTHELCLATDHLNRTLVARRCASTAAVAFFFVNLNDFTFQSWYLPCFSETSIVQY